MMIGEAPQESEPCWTCGGDWDECRHDPSTASDLDVLQALRDKAEQGGPMHEYLQALHNADLIGRVRELEAALASVRWVYNLQCGGPILRENYVDAGAYSAHLWWKKVLGSALDEAGA